MKNIQTIFISIALCVVSIVAVVALSTVTHATGTCSGDTLYKATIDVDYAVATEFTLSQISSDFATHLKTCETSYDVRQVTQQANFGYGGSVGLVGDTVTITVKGLKGLKPTFRLIARNQDDTSSIRLNVKVNVRGYLTSCPSKHNDGGTLYRAEVLAEAGQEKKIIISDISPDFVSHLTACGIAFDGMQIRDRFNAVNQALHGATVDNAFITVAITSDLEQYLLRAGKEAVDVLVSAILDKESSVSLRITVKPCSSAEGTCGDEKDQEVSGEGAIVPGYLTCRVAGRGNCGERNAHAWNVIGLGF